MNGELGWIEQVSIVLAGLSVVVLTAMVIIANLLPKGREKRCKHFE
jgi:hypothetical protein